MELKATRRNLAAARVGKPLVVTGIVRGEDCAPLPGATINVWQTNGKAATARHGRPGPCCYLAGTVRTGADGRYTLDTVMPRGYDGGPAHIHMHAGHPKAQGVTTELVFDARGGDHRVRHRAARFLSRLRRVDHLALKVSWETT